MRRFAILVLLLVATMAPAAPASGAPPEHARGPADRPPQAARPGHAGRPPHAGRPAHAGRCAGFDEATGTRADRRPAPGNLQRMCLRLNQIQVMGTHNSYKQDVVPQILGLLELFDPTLAASLEYSHAPLPEQFDHQGIRQIELDVFADSEGGLYAGRVGLDVAGLPNETPPELTEPGFKVLHVQDLDFTTSCLTFVACLEQVDEWSDANPRHLPIAVLVELKDDPIPDPFDFGFVVPEQIGTDELDRLDAEIRSVFDESEMITPDDVRGARGSLEDAVLSGGWPTLREAAGKVLFLMDNGGAERDVYRAGRPSLQGRVLFTNSTPGSPDAAFVKVNEPVGNVDRIQDLVASGYLVRTRADEPTVQARSGDTTQLEAALASGAQWVSTDYPVPGSSPFSDYFAAIPGGDPARCNPVNTGPRCEAGTLARG